MSQAGVLSSSGGGGGGITTIDGDVGSITGSTVTIFADQAAVNSGSSVAFVNSGTISTLNVTDTSNNTIIGSGAGVLVNTANSCTGLGQGCLASITDDDSHVAVGRGALASANDATSNTAVGAFCLTSVVGGGGNTGSGDRCGRQLTSGNFNTLYGYFTGQNYTGAESSNLLLQNDGVLGESNVIRIGTQGSGSAQQNTCFIAGVAGVTVSNTNVVTIDTTTGQLGSQAPGGSGFTQIVTQIFTSSGTYTPTAGMKYCIVECVGGGGGSGGCARSNTGTVAISGGGGGGGYARIVLSAATVGASQTVTVGAGGAAGTSTPGDGGTGGTSSLGILCVATGGVGSVAGPSIVSSFSTNIGGLGGVGTTGDLLVNGTAGGCGIGSGTTLNVSTGGGGSSFYGSGGISNTGDGVGFDGNLFGGGATGSSCFNIGVNPQGPFAGGSGAAGIVIVTEFI